MDGLMERLTNMQVIRWAAWYKVRKHFQDEAAERAMKALKSK